MLWVQIKEQEAEFQGTSLTNFVVVAQNYYLKKTHRTVVGGNMRKVSLTVKSLKDSESTSWLKEDNQRHCKMGFASKI